METTKRVRGGHKSRVTTINPKLIEELAETTPNKDNVQMYTEELIRQKEIILELDTEITTNTTDPAEVNKLIEESSEFMMKLNLTISKGIKFLERQTRTNANEDRQGAERPQEVKLPLLALNKFSGDTLDWLNFWELFRTAVHERTDIQPPSKFKYLISQLEGEAARLLAGFSQTEDAYFEAVDLLKKTYGQKKIQIQTRLNALFDIKSPSESVESLSDFRSTFEGHLRVLKTLGQDIDHAGYVYAHMLLRKLPAKTKDNINRAHSSDTWTLDDLRKAINAEISFLSSADDRKQLKTYIILDIN